MRRLTLASVLLASAAAHAQSPRLVPPFPMQTTAGQPARGTVSIVRNGYSWTLTLSATPTPPGSSATLSPNRTAGSRSLLTIATAATTPAAAYSMLLSASGIGLGLLAPTSPFTVDVNPCGHHYVVQDGTADFDRALAVANAPAGGFYTGGDTYSHLAAANPDPSGRTADAWLARYDHRGTLLWEIQLGVGRLER